MWIELRKVYSRMVAEMWKEFLEGEGMPCRLLPEGQVQNGGELATYRVMIPKEKDHVVAEILRKM